MAEWNGNEIKDLSYQLNTDFDVTTIDANFMNAINKSVETRTMSQKTAIANYKKGELLPDGHSVEDEIDQIAVESSGLNEFGELNEIVENIVQRKITEKEPVD